MNDRSTAPSISVAVAGAAIRVTHDSCTALGTPAPDIVVVRQPDVALDTMTRIEVWPHNRPPHVILLLWEWGRNPAHDGVGVLLCTESDTLFLGARTFAAAVRLADKQVIGEHTVDLFWGFQRVGEHIVELGELSCYLRTLTGEILAEASVDPPYEMFITSEGIRFESIVMGTTWLRFPGSHLDRS